MLGEKARNVHVMRVPDKPSIDDLNAIGVGNHDYDESKNGLLVLDECGTWFNSRNWQDKSRKAVNDWFLHARKLGWDVFLIIQDISLLDSQAREALAEHTVFCKRLDNLRIPLIGGLVQALTGIKLKLPRMHVARVVYGTSQQDMLSDRWVYRGTQYFNWYDTRQLFLTDYQHGVYSMLTPWHTHYRHRVPKDWGYYMRLTKIYWKRFRSPIALGVGLMMGASVTAAAVAAYSVADYEAKKKEAELVAAKFEIERLKQKPVSESPGQNSNEYNPMTEYDWDRVAISSYFQLGSRTNYELAEYDAAGNIGRIVNSEELAAYGVHVTAVDDCLAVFRYRGESSRITCNPKKGVSAKVKASNLSSPWRGPQRSEDTGA